MNGVLEDPTNAFAGDGIIRGEKREREEKERERRGDAEKRKNRRGFAKITREFY